MQSDSNHITDDVRNVLRTEQIPLSGSTYHVTSVNNSLNNADVWRCHKNILTENSNWTSMGTDIDSPVGEVTQHDNRTLPSFNAIVPEEPNFHQKLITASQRMERMQEKMDDLEQKFQEITKYLQDNPVSKSDVKPPLFKAWHSQICQELRDHLVKKLMNAILPVTFPIDERILHKLEAYSKKVEKDIYETAESKALYYHMLAEKYYKIHKEIDELRRQKIARRS